ncbi:Adamts-Like Protein 1 [Manis pentadactyla]|nr:Adamts-Like Protein 1 [Manis pentadactyla]
MTLNTDQSVSSPWKSLEDVVEKERNSETVTARPSDFFTGHKRDANIGILTRRTISGGADPSDPCTAVLPRSQVEKVLYNTAHLAKPHTLGNVNLTPLFTQNSKIDQGLYKTKSADIMEEIQYAF